MHTKSTGLYDLFLRGLKVPAALAYVSVPMLPLYAARRQALMPDEIAEKIFRLIAAIKRIPQESISMDSTFEQLHMDSLDAINLVYEIDSEFNCYVPDEMARSIKSVLHLVDNLKTVLAGPLPDSRPIE